MAKYLARSFPDIHLYGKTATESSLVDWWLDVVSDGPLNSADFKVLNAAFLEMNNHLKLRSFFVGYQVTLADICIWGALRCKSRFINFGIG